MVLFCKSLRTRKRKLGECYQMQSVSKNMSCHKITYLPKSMKLSLTTQITFVHSLWEEVICVVRPRKFRDIHFFVTPQIHSFFSRKQGKLRPPITQPKIPFTPLCHTYSEPQMAQAYHDGGVCKAFFRQIACEQSLNVWKKSKLVTSVVFRERLLSLVLEAAKSA